DQRGRRHGQGCRGAPLRGCLQRAPGVRDAASNNDPGLAPVPAPRDPGTPPGGSSALTRRGRGQGPIDQEGGTPRGGPNIDTGGEFYLPLSLDVMRACRADGATLSSGSVVGKGIPHVPSLSSPFLGPRRDPACGPRRVPQGEPLPPHGRSIRTAIP